MFKSNDDTCIKPSIFSSISFIFGIGNGFLLIILFNLLKPDNNLIGILFFGWIKVGAPHSNLFSFEYPYLENTTSLLLKIASFTLETGYGLSWYVCV